MLFGGFFGVHRCRPRARCAREAGRGVSWFGSVCLARAERAAVLAGRGGLSSLAWYLYLKRPDLPARIAARLHGIYSVLVNKYYFDEFYQALFAGGARRLGTGLWKFGDVAIIDGFFVNGAARVVGWTFRSDPAIPVRLHLPLRIHDDHRRVRAADAVVRARLGLGSTV